MDPLPTHGQPQIADPTFLAARLDAIRTADEVRLEVPDDVYLYRCTEADYAVQPWWYGGQTPEGRAVQACLVAFYDVDRRHAPMTPLLSKWTEYAYAVRDG